MFQNCVSVVFRLATVTFLLGGLAIVAGQVVGLVIGDGQIVTQVAQLLAPYVYGSAGVAGLLAFVMSYSGRDDDESDVDPSAPATLKPVDASLPGGSSQH